MPTGVEVLVYADDLALVATTKHIHEVEYLLEKAAETTLPWFKETRLQVAIEKSKIILFTNRRIRNTITILLRKVKITQRRASIILAFTWTRN